MSSGFFCKQSARISGDFAHSRGGSMKTNPLVLSDAEIMDVLRRRLPVVFFEAPHRIEELANGGKIIRPAYKAVTPRRAYVPMESRAN